MAEFQFLGKGQLKVENGSIEVHLLTGELWVTIEGDGTDYVLKAGEKLSNASDGLMVVEALTDSSISYSRKNLGLDLGA